MMGYPEAVWQRFAAPTHAGALAPPAVRTGRVESPGADATLELDVCLVDGVVAASAFRAHGCPATVAAADWLCERLSGRRPHEAMALTARHIEAALELAPEKRVCCLLAVDALFAALDADVTVDTA